MKFDLRPAAETDRQFLYVLHCQTMRDVIEKTWGWDEAWQRKDFDRRFNEYLVSIIESEGQAAGGLMLEWKPDSLYIHEIQLLPQYQGRGVSARRWFKKSSNRAPAGGFRSPSRLFQLIHAPSLSMSGLVSR